MKIYFKRFIGGYIALIGILYIPHTIYAIEHTGELVRSLLQGKMSAGDYTSRSKAVYWDGRNENGEKVSSGVYLYTINAGEFSATRKMLIQK